ncbi:hypothetical protein [Azospirillum formosense]|uniref:hypothetical protein n=1 Tax=Azospirillum formosense TaxID=861533 RepID=UPI00338F2882
MREWLLDWPGGVIIEVVAALLDPLLEERLPAADRIENIIRNEKDLHRKSP